MRCSCALCEAAAVAGEATTTRRREGKMATVKENDVANLSPNLVVVNPLSKKKPRCYAELIAMPNSTPSLVTNPSVAPTSLSRRRRQIRWREGREGAPATAAAASSPKRRRQSGGGQAAPTMGKRESNTGLGKKSRHQIYTTSRMRGGGR